MSILLEKKADTAFLTLDRPPLNVLDLPALRQLQAALDSLRADEAVDFLVIRGGGERAFSAGVDVKDHTRDKVPEMLEVVHGAIRTLLSLPQITIAQVRGACLGGGCEIASSCDFILASEKSFFATPEIQVGCYPPVALARFPSQIGYHRAVELILTGRRIPAREAAAIGLINRAVPAAGLDAAVQKLLEELRGKSRAVLRLTLKGLRELSLKGFSERLARSEEIYLKELLKTDDVEEGARAFLEKRKPAWRHR
ncbi:MAG: enoyl-CoA hydratase/isomerase family protein [Deltaproteobacteria bacterium]|nr:enoyl-CoA hydratase/isomerase family protein [Deltaproteobacteria bacterium]MBI2539084.1 enoyl-CoA hydratase/isomerase family protein [Deltaproteobacteria bacterium]MBI3063101.1 enoyl-CoA hydratase/isomerase family protein [Deltaproteobacteria bacterium]